MLLVFSIRDGTCSTGLPFGIVHDVTALRNLGIITTIVGANDVVVCVPEKALVWE